MKTNSIIKNWYLLFTLLITSVTLQSQEKQLNQSIDSLFLTYNSHYKEVVYVHLNKSIYIRGEYIGFTAYSFNKHDNILSNKTSNLYCVIYDSNQNLVKKQLLKVENGIANGHFVIDSDFKKGKYTFKAYTNWMLNFSEESFFTDSFEVLDPEETKFVEKKKKSHKIDIQILPESGHLLTGVINTLGVVAKDTLGYGYPFLKGDVFDQDNNFINSFKLNKLGIGRFSMTPKKNTTYKVVYNNNGENIITNFGENSKDNGIILQLNINENAVFVSSITNKSTLPFLKERTYTIAYHNGIKLTKFNFNFNKGNIVTKKIALNGLNKGINIFTLFDSDNQPIAERLFFNYNTIEVNTVVNSNFDNKNDTLQSFNFSFKKGIKGFNNVSISVLPKGTKSYKKNSNIIANVLVKPYIKGYLENGGYYFTNINNQKKYDLDNLLITQGWSSYNWKNLFSYKTNYVHNFEKGISLKINLQNEISSSNTFFMYGLLNKKPEYISFDKNSDKKSFISDDFYPMNNQNAYISEVRENDGKLVETALYTQFFPNSIPETNKSANYLPTNNNFYELESASELNSFKTLNTQNVLDEIVIKANLDKERILKIRNKAIGTVKFTTLQDTYLTLAEYINFNSISFRALRNLTTGTLDIVLANSFVNVGMASSGSNESDGIIEEIQPINESEPIGTNGAVVFIDDVRILNTGVLFNFPMTMVDYIEFDRSGFGEGIRAINGVIRIFTDPLKFYEDTKRPTTTAIKFPLTFTKAKKFYAPQYTSYTDNFYKSYGVIDWLPINKIDKNGNLNLKINNLKTNEITFFIEGVSEDGTFIFDQKTIHIKPAKSF